MDRHDDPTKSRPDTVRMDGPENPDGPVIRAAAAGSTTERPAEVNRSASHRTAGDAGRTPGDRVGAMADKTKSKLADVADKAGDALSDTGERAARAAETAKDKAETAGPVLSSVLGALAGSVGGWWMGRSEPDDDSGYTADDERHYREHFEENRRPGVIYPEARTGYVLGHMAARNPAYEGRDFKDVEPDLRLGFHGEYGARFDYIRDYAKHAYERRSGGIATALLGALAGALGGWWAASSQDTASKMPKEEDTAYRTHFASIPARNTKVTYEAVRPGYTLGYLAARNPSYQGRSFEEIEPELRRGFAGEHASSYDTLREYAQHAYERGKGGGTKSR